MKYVRNLWVGVLAVNDAFGFACYCIFRFMGTWVCLLLIHWLTWQSPHSFHSLIEMKQYYSSGYFQAIALPILAIGGSYHVHKFNLLHKRVEELHEKVDRK